MVSSLQRVSCKQIRWQTVKNTAFHQGPHSWIFWEENTISFEKHNMWTVSIYNGPPWLNCIKLCGTLGLQRVKWTYTAIKWNKMPRFFVWNTSTSIRRVAMVSLNGYAVLSEFCLTIIWYGIGIAGKVLKITNAQNQCLNGTIDTYWPHPKVPPIVGFFYSVHGGRR